VLRDKGVVLVGVGLGLGISRWFGVDVSCRLYLQASC